jgi:SAM-dependent methyltransferase
VNGFTAKEYTLVNVMRRTNNDIKREFLNRWVKKGSKVLDAGCGQGGDIHKWHALNVDYTGFDPNPLAIDEARRRAYKMNWKILPKFLVGLVSDAPVEQFDIVCYNFSFQYQDPSGYPEIVKRLRPGGLLLGIVPDPTRFGEGQNNGISIFQGSIPGKVGIYIPGTPYYEGGPIEEPVVTRESVTSLLGLDTVLWGESFSIYSKFVFRC